MEQGLQIHKTSLRNVAESVAMGSAGTREQVLDRRRYSPVPYLAARERFHFTPAASVAQSSRAADVLMRILDIVGSLIILVVTLPITLVAALLVKLTSRGPVLYTQERVGKAGQVFTLYKFRTMIDGAEDRVGPVWAAKDDDRVTWVGRILRRMRLDELPQLYNILAGDMSLVGPRPERPFFVERHEALQGVRLSVKPGLTGLAQIRSFYDLKPAHKARYDNLYIRHRSLLLNIYILLLTIPVVLTRKGW
jgi:lipopolysaccharide/colanic/teichoic acid biosynthesis glycosyltransferase